MNRRNFLKISSKAAASVAVLASIPSMLSGNEEISEKSLISKINQSTNPKSQEIKSYGKLSEFPGKFVATPTFYSKEVIAYADTGEEICKEIKRKNLKDPVVFYNQDPNKTYLWSVF
jgi:uncharacterized protein DUF5678